MESIALLDRAGRRRSPATTATFHKGCRRATKGSDIRPDPPTVEEIVAVMHAAGKGPDGVRLRGVVVVLWRAGLRISEALALNETDLDPERGALLVRHGKGDKRREVGMDRWAWSQARAADRSAGPTAVLRRPRTDTRPAMESVAVGAVTDTAHHRDDLLNRRRIDRVLLAVVSWRAAPVIARHGRR
jgi:integrase